MAPPFKLMRQKWFPRPHDMKNSWFHSLEGATQDTTIYPLVHYDEGLGAPNLYNSNPDHASFAEAGMSNCYPNSSIDFITSIFEFYMTKGAITTDAIPVMKFATMPVFMSFKEDYTAIDEASIEVQDILEMQFETTDKQGGALYDTNKLTPRFTNSSLLNAAEPFLTTNQQLENVAFSVAAYYDATHYRTIQGKLKNCNAGLQWHTLTKTRPYMKYKLTLNSKAKFMNEYAFLGLLIHFPQSGSKDQLTVIGDTTADLAHLGIITKNRYNEWHQGFDHDEI